jgi:hypothetical protein
VRSDRQEPHAFLVRSIAMRGHRCCGATLCEAPWEWTDKVAESCLRSTVPNDVYAERKRRIELLVRTPASPGEARHAMDVRPLAFGGIDLTASASAAGSRGGVRTETVALTC